MNASGRDATGIDPNDGGVAVDPADRPMPARMHLALRAAARYAALTGLLAGAILAWSAWRYGNPLGLPQVLGGRVLVARRLSLDCGALSPGQTRDATFRLKNIAAGPVSIVGMRASCSCAALRDLPLKVAPGEAFDLPVRIHLRDAAKPGEFRINIELLLDTASAPITLEAFVLVRAARA